jgi:hypothetical protein
MQDRTTSIEDLSVEAEFNILADDLAADFASSTPTTSNITDQLNSTKCILEVDGKSIHGNYNKALRRAAAEDELHEYLTHKHG